MIQNWSHFNIHTFYSPTLIDIPTTTTNICCFMSLNFLPIICLFYIKFMKQICCCNFVIKNFFSVHICIMLCVTKIFLAKFFMYFLCIFFRRLGKLANNGIGRKMHNRRKKNYLLFWKLGDFHWSYDEWFRMKQNPEATNLLYFFKITQNLFSPTKYTRNILKDEISENI